MALRASQDLEYRILKFLRATRSGQYRATTLPELASMVSCSDWGELVNALRRLHKRGVLRLRKWQDNPAGFFDYSPGANEDFFHHGGFQLGDTPETAPYFEGLEQQSVLGAALWSGLEATTRRAMLGLPSERELRRLERLSAPALETLRQLEKAETVLGRDLGRDLANARLIEQLNRQFRGLGRLTDALEPAKATLDQIGKRFAEMATLSEAAGARLLPDLRNVTLHCYEMSQLAQKINLQLPMLARDAWLPTVLAERMPLIEHSLKNVGVLQRLQMDVGRQLAEQRLRPLRLDAMGVAGQFVFDYGAFVRRLPPPIPVDGQDSADEERLRALDEQVAAKLEAGLEELDPRLASLWRQAWQSFKKGGPAAARSAALGLREVSKDVLHALAPDEQVKRTEAWLKRKDQRLGRPTRDMRVKYIVGSAGRDADLLAQFGKSIDAAHRFAHTFADPEIVRVRMSMLQDCIYLLLCYAKGRGE